MNPIKVFAGMSPIARLGTALLCASTPMGVLAIINPMGIFVLISAVLAFIGMILLLWKIILARLDKAKGKQMERGLKEQASAAPVGAADAASRARMDDLRKSWEEGIAKFRERGKDLYSVPWYMMVGESGSGKTEAIRHCNVGFPPGLQDKLQGSGGTMNMHWWFTNQSVIIDTAGRLLQDSGRQEWRQFLKMLRKARPLRPINGLLLVIPSDSLIKDNGDDLERKGGRIASALDEIQDELGVRFPVYLVITKCDLINGFREYFDAMPDPELKLQDQMLGWSNPAPLDEAFNPAVVDQHLKSIRDRLVQRRYQLLLDPVHTEDSTRRRIEQVDALYAFPDTLVGLAPRLRRYLEMVFVAGEWSRKPLFIRGIYFTSSMQEGAALDAELAEALGVKIADLQQENVAAKREKTFFLRDMFVSKVFKEQGLVTAAANVKKSQGAQRTVMLATGFIAGVLGLGLTVWSWLSLQSAIGSTSRFWTDASRLLADNFHNAAIISGDPGSSQFTYFGAGKVSSASLPNRGTFDQGLGPAGDITFAEIPAQTLQQVVRDTRTRVPLIFKPIAAFTGGDPFKQQAEAHEAVYRGLVLDPLVEAVQRKITLESAAASGSTPVPWTPEATAALAQLIRLEAARVDTEGLARAVGLAAAASAIPTPGSPGSAPAAPSAANLQNAANQFGGTADTAATIRGRGGPVEIGPLVQYALERSLPNPGVPPERVREQIAMLQNVTDDTFRSGDGGANRDWSRTAAAVTGEPTRAAIAAGVDRFISDWNGRTTGGNSEQLARLTALRDALLAFDRAEQALWPSLAMRQATTQAGYREAGSEWRRLYNDVEAANTALTAAIGALGTDVSNLTAVSEAARTQLLNDATQAFRLLRSEIPGGLSPTAVIRAEHSPLLQDCDQKLRAGLNQIEQDVASRIEAIRVTLTTLQPNLLQTFGTGQTLQYAYQRRFAMYQAANVQVIAAGSVDDPPPELTVLDLAAHLQSAEAANTRARDTVRAQAQDSAGVENFTKAQTACTYALDASLRKIRFDAIAAALRGVNSPRDVQSLVAQSASGEGRTVIIQGLPLTNWASDAPVSAEFNPLGAKAAFDAVTWAANAAALPAAASESSPPMPRVLEQQQIDGFIAGANTVLRQYARDYLGYWTESLPAALAVQPKPTWPAFRQDMSDLLIPNIARDIETNALVFQDALSAIPTNLLDATTSADRTRALAIASYEQSRKGGDREEALRLTQALSNLGSSAGEARTRILGMSRGTFVNTYLAVFYPLDPNNTDVIRYWKSLTYAAIASIATESGGLAFRALQRLQTDHRAFPLCSDETRVLTPQQLQEALSDINALAIAPAGTSAAAAQDSMGHPDTQLRDRPLDNQLAALRGGSFVTDQNREWFSKLRALATVLASDPASGQRLTYDLAIISLDEANAARSRNPAAGRLASENFGYFNVRVGGVRQRWTQDSPNDAGGVRTRTPNTCSNLPLPNPDALTLEFAQNPEARPDQPLAERGGQTKTYSDHWAALRLIATPGAFIPQGDTGATAQHWRVPVSLSLAGESLQFWVDIKFSRPIPIPAQWPNSNNWWQGQ